VTTFTAHVGWEPPSRLMTAGQRRTGVFHAIADQDISAGFYRRSEGEPLCGAVFTERGARLEPLRSPLLPSQLTCSRCLYQIGRFGITLTGTEQGGEKT
jgi:hypothetical protein